MAKYSRTCYAEGNLRDIAIDIAHQAAIHKDSTEMGLAYDTLHERRAAGRRRVRITVLVEPEKAPPKRPRRPSRARPVQLSLVIGSPT